MQKLINIKQFCSLAQNRTGIRGFGNPYTIPVRLASAGRALYYEFNLVFKNLLPADDLKYFSLLIAFSLALNCQE